MLYEFCRTSGFIPETLEAYYGQAFNCGGFVVHYSHPKDSWFRMFDDLPLDMPRTTQMHYDLDFYPPKAMLYLNDVGEAKDHFLLFPKQANGSYLDLSTHLERKRFTAYPPTLPPLTASRCAATHRYFAFGKQHAHLCLYRVRCAEHRTPATILSTILTSAYSCWLRRRRLLAGGDPFRQS